MSETATNVSFTFEDVDIVREAIFAWVVAPVAPDERQRRASEFAGFAVRHPELILTLPKPETETETEALA